MPATAGTASGLLIPGITVTGDTGLLAGDDLLVPATEHEVVATLEPGDPLAGQGRLDDDLVDLFLVCRAPARQLGDVDDLGVGGQLGQQLAGSETVGDDDVGLHQRLASGDRDQLRVARAAADEDDARGRVAVTPRCERALAETGDDLVAQAGVPPRVPVRGRAAHHGHGVAPVPPDSRGEGGGGVRVVGPDAEDALLPRRARSPAR